MFELVYTSAPRLLEAGKTGFGTLLCTKGMPQPLVSFLERISAFDRGAGIDASECYTIYRMGGVTFHVFSRIGDCGADYTGRTNHVAHHFVIEEGTPEAQEMMKFHTPVSVLSCLASMWVTTCPDAPQYTEERRVRLYPIRGGASAWTELTGSPVKAGWLAVHPYDGACCLIFPGVAQISLCLLVLHEGYLYKPDKGWGCGFSTALISTISANLIPVTCLDMRQQASGVKPGRSTPILELRTSLAIPPERPTWHPDPISAPTVAPSQSSLTTYFRSPVGQQTTAPQSVDPPEPDIIPPNISPISEHGGVPLSRIRVSSRKITAALFLLIGVCCICGTYFVISHKAGSEKTEPSSNQEQPVQPELSGSQMPQVKTEQTADQDKTKNSEPSGIPVPATKPEPSGIPSPAAKPEPSGIPVPAAKPEPSGIPAPAAKPEPSGIPVPATKPESSDTRVPAAKPEPSSIPVPATKPEPVGSREPSLTTESGGGHRTANPYRNADSEPWILKDGDKGVKIKINVEEKEKKEKYKVTAIASLTPESPTEKKFRGWNCTIESDGKVEGWSGEIQLTQSWDVGFDGEELLPEYRISHIRPHLEKELKKAKKELKNAIKDVGRFAPSKKGKEKGAQTEQIGDPEKWEAVSTEFSKWAKDKSEKLRKETKTVWKQTAEKINEFLNGEEVESEDDEIDEEDEEDEGEDEEDTEENEDDNEDDNEDTDVNVDSEKCEADNTGKGNKNEEKKNKKSVDGSKTKDKYRDALQRLRNAVKDYDEALDSLSKQNVNSLIRKTKKEAGEYLKQKYRKDTYIALSIKEERDEVKFVTFGAEIKLRSESHEQKK